MNTIELSKRIFSLVQSAAQMALSCRVFFDLFLALAGTSESDDFETSRDSECAPLRKAALLGDFRSLQISARPTNSDF